MKVSEFAEGGGVAGVSRVGREVPQHHLQEANGRDWGQERRG